MELIATYFVGDIFEILDHENSFEVNSTVCPSYKGKPFQIFVSDDSDVVFVYNEGYIEKIHDGRYFLMLDGSGYWSHDLQSLEKLMADF